MAVTPCVENQCIQYIRCKEEKQFFFACSFVYAGVFLQSGQEEEAFISDGYRACRDLPLACPARDMLLSIYA